MSKTLDLTHDQGHECAVKFLRQENVNLDNFIPTL